jgi:lipoprotein-anchoring transpeptidase ErfK/SrfK
MGKRSLIIFAGVLIGVLVLGAGALYAYDHGRRDKIAKGVKVAGIDVGGLNAAQARARLSREYLPRFEHPVVVRFHAHRFKLSPRAAHVTVDVNGAVDEALQRSRDGSIFTRVSRALTGGSLDTDIQPQVSYSHAAVARLVGRVKHTIDRPARDASVSYGAASLGAVPSQTGVAVRTAALAAALNGALEHPSGRQQITVRTTVTKPKVTTSALASRYPSFITIDRGHFTLRVYRDLKLARSYPIAVGQQGLETPAGLYHIQNKAVDPPWQVPNSPWAGALAGKLIPPGPQDPIKARWMGIFNGAGIHGTDETGSIGHAFSHGCVRMLIPDVIDLYDRVSVGTPVYIGD